MQRGDEGKVAAARGILLRLQHLAREQGGERVRDGVVNVEQVERVELGDLGHAGGEREVVGRVLEERVVVDVDFVKVDVGLAAVEAEGRGRGDEMDFVAARGEFDAEFRGDYAAAAIGGVAGDADLAQGSGRHEESGRSQLDERPPRTMLPDNCRIGVGWAEKSAAVPRHRRRRHRRRSVVALPRLASDRGRTGAGLLR